MTRDELQVFLKKTDPMTLSEIRTLLKEHDSCLVSHELQVEIFAESPPYINLILFHYKQIKKGSIGRYKSEPLLAQYAEDGRATLCSFPLPSRKN